MLNITHCGPEKSRVAKSFGLAAHSYDGVAALQREAGRKLLEGFEVGATLDAVVLDAGAGTGFFSTELAARHPGARVVALDLSEGMLGVAGERFNGWRVNGDMEALPLSKASVDRIFSNMAIQWCDADAVMREFRRVLKPGGGLCLTSLGPATLHELRRAWAKVDDGVHVNDFASRVSLKDALVNHGFSTIAIDVSPQILEYPDVMTLMRELKRLGAHNLMPRRSRGLTGKGTLRAMMGAYTDQFSSETGVQASFEVFHVHARVREE